jgi:hypothetical protein
MGNSVDRALETQIKNIQTKTGKTLDELKAIIQRSGLTKHGEIRDMLKRELGLGHGDANTLTHHALRDENEHAGGTETADAADEIYTGPKTALRPIHDRFMTAIQGFGAFEIAPKKGYVSLRRKKQFAMIGPVTNTRVEVGINMKGVPGTERLVEQPSGGMCQYKVRVADAGEVNEELIGWVRRAYDAAE